MGKIRLNTNPDIVRQVRQGILANGGYCPCFVERSEDTKCICTEFKAQMEDPEFEGYCHCRLYYKEK